MSKKYRVAVVVDGLVKADSQEEAQQYANEAVLHYLRYHDVIHGVTEVTVIAGETSA